MYVILVLDRSGSMGHQMDALQSGLAAALSEFHDVNVVAFDSKSEVYENLKLHNSYVDDVRKNEFLVSFEESCGYIVDVFYEHGRKHGDGRVPRDRARRPRLHRWRPAAGALELLAVATRRADAHALGKGRAA